LTSSGIPRARTFLAREMDFGLTLSNSEALPIDRPSEYWFPPNREDTNARAEHGPLRFVRITPVELAVDQEPYRIVACVSLKCRLAFGQQAGEIEIPPVQNLPFIPNYRIDGVIRADKARRLANARIVTHRDYRRRQRMQGKRRCRNRLISGLTRTLIDFGVDCLLSGWQRRRIR
jgi:hypothetical protein